MARHRSCIRTSRERSETSWTSVGPQSSISLYAEMSSSGLMGDEDPGKDMAPERWGIERPNYKAKEYWRKWFSEQEQIKKQLRQAI
jgi:hypothetical protein